MKNEKRENEKRKKEKGKMKALSICHKRRQNDAAFTLKKKFSEFFWLFLYGFYHFLDNIFTSWEWSIGTFGIEVEQL